MQDKVCRNTVSKGSIYAPTYIRLQNIKIRSKEEHDLSRGKHKKVPNREHN